MAIDYSILPLSKGRPAALRKQDRAKAKQSVEARENAKVKARSKGQCEVRRAVVNVATGKTYLHRCTKPAREIHHMLGGSGRRGVGESAKAENKLHTCSGPNGCHDLITRRILQVHWTHVEDRAGTHYGVRLT